MNKDKTMRLFLVVLLLLCVPSMLQAEDAPKYYAQFSVTVRVPQRLVETAMAALRLEDGKLGDIHISGEMRPGRTDSKTKMVYVSGGGFTEEAYSLAKLQAAQAQLLALARGINGAENPSAMLYVSAEPMAPRPR